MFCSAGCRGKCNKSNFLLTHPQPDLYVKSQWTTCGCTCIFYLIYRILAAVGFITMILVSGLEYRPGHGSGKELEGPLYFIYLTKWSFLILTIDVIMQCAVTCYGFYKYRKADNNREVFDCMTWYLRMQWVISNIASNAGILVTIVYWATLYEGGPITGNNFNVHATNSIYILINVFITAMPVRIYHAFHLWIYAVIYLVFSVIYQVGFNQPAIYSILDWKDNTTLSIVISIVLAFCGSTVVWLIYYGLYRIRLFIYYCHFYKGDLPTNRQNLAEEYPEQGHSNPVQISDSV